MYNLCWTSRHDSRHVTPNKAMYKKNKEKLYKFYIKHIDTSLENKNYFESSWLSYVLIEDRLVSLLMQTGGNKATTNKKGKKANKPIQMLGPKIVELEKRLKTDALLKKELKTDLLDSLKDWKDDRNNLMHSMADGKLTVNDIQTKIEKLATDGRDIARNIAATSRRVKKKNKKSKLKLAGKRK